MVQDAIGRLRQEIEDTIVGYGATGYISGFSGEHAFVEFQINGRHIRIGFELPKIEDFKMTPQQHRARSTASQHKEWQDACKDKWYKVMMMVKGKLGAVSSGIAKMDDEFMPYVVMPNNQTIAQIIKPQIEQAFRGGNMPSLLPPGVIVEVEAEQVL